MDIRNIYCVGRNYRLHAQELGNDVPTTPMLFTKPTHALTEMSGQDITLPGDLGEMHHECELVLLVDRAFEPGMRVEDVVSRMALGIDFTLRDLQSEIKKKGQPWLPAKGFRNSALISEFRAFPGEEALKETDFTLEINGKEVQRGNISDVVFDLQTLVEFIAKNYGLGAGDLIYTGTPAGVGPVADGDRLTLKFGNETLGVCIVRF